MQHCSLQQARHVLTYAAANQTQEMREVRQEAGKKWTRKQTAERDAESAAAPQRWCQELTAAYIIPVHQFPLSDFEEAVLVQAQHLHGNKWTLIAEQYMPWRAPLDLRSFRYGRGAAAKASQNWLCQQGYSLDWLLTQSTPEYQGLWHRYHAAMQATGGAATGRGTKRSSSSKQHQGGSKSSGRDAALTPDMQPLWMQAGSAAAGAASWQDMTHFQGLDAAFQAACAASQPTAAGALDPSTWLQGHVMPPTAQLAMAAAQGYSYSQGDLNWDATCSMPMLSTAPQAALGAAGSWVPAGMPLQLPAHAACPPARRVSTSVSTAPWPWLAPQSSNGLAAAFAQQQQQLLLPAQINSHGSSSYMHSSSPGLFDSMLAAGPDAGGAGAAAAAAAMSAPGMQQPAAAGQRTGSAGAGSSDSRQHSSHAVPSTGEFVGAGLGAEGAGTADAAGAKAGSSALHLHAGHLHGSLAQASQAQGPAGTSQRAAVPAQGVTQHCGTATAQDDGDDPFSFLDSMPAFDVPSWAQEAAEQAAAAALTARSGPRSAGAGHGSSDLQLQEAARQSASPPGSASPLWILSMDADTCSAPDGSCLLPSPVAVDAPSWAEEAAEEAAAAAMGLYAASAAAGAGAAGSAAQHTSTAVCDAHIQPMGAGSTWSPAQESSLSAGTVFGSAPAPALPQMHQHDSSRCRSVGGDSIAAAHKLSGPQGVTAAPAPAVHQPAQASFPGNSGSSGSCSVATSSRGVSTPDSASTVTGAVFRLQGPGPAPSPSAGIETHRESSCPAASAADGQAAVGWQGPEAAVATGTGVLPMPPCGVGGSSSPRAGRQQLLCNGPMQGSAQQQQGGQGQAFYANLLDQLLQQMSPAAAPSTEGPLQAKGSSENSPAACAGAEAAWSQWPKGAGAALGSDEWQQGRPQSTVMTSSTAGSAAGDSRGAADTGLLRCSSIGRVSRAVAAPGCAMQEQRPVAACTAVSEPMPAAVCDAQTAQQQLLAAVIQQGDIKAIAAAEAAAAKALRQRMALQQQHGVSTASTKAASVAPAGHAIQQQQPPATAAAGDESPRVCSSTAELQAQTEGLHAQQYACADASTLLDTTDATDLDAFFEMDDAFGPDSFFDGAFDLF